MWGDVDPRTGRPFFDHGGEVTAGWVTAVKGVDGWGASVASFGNLTKAAAEFNEQIFPHLLRGRNFITDSGGAGQWRGGCGSNFVKEVRTPTYVNQYVVNQRHTQPGIAGGGNGSPDICDLKVGGPPEAVVRVNPSVSGLLLETGERLDYQFGGGGGWGDPLARDPQAVLEDVWDEYVSVEGARRDYGVVITGSLADMDLALDLGATNQLRAELRAAR
jgi:N-methylhydantoinase B